MLLYHHLFYHPKRATLPTMTVIPCERATLTEVPYQREGMSGSAPRLHLATRCPRIHPGSERCQPVFGLPEFMHSVKKKSGAFLQSSVPTCIARKPRQRRQERSAAMAWPPGTPSFNIPHSGENGT